MGSEYYFPPFSSFNHHEKMENNPSSSSYSSSVFAFPPILTSNHQKQLPKPEPIDSFHFPDLNDEWIYQLPTLHSLEENNNNTNIKKKKNNHNNINNKKMKNLPISVSTKRFRYSSPPQPLPPPPPSATTSTTTDSYTLEAIVRNHLRPPSSPLLLPSSSSTTSSSSLSPNERARKRRKDITEKTRLLAKLMPWEKKLDTATMFGEAYKYIKFLQAQVNVLQSMPFQSSFISSSSCGDVGGGDGGTTSAAFGGLEKLNRQQLLQVLVNSPVAQTAFSSQQCCVYSLEQVLWFKKNLMEQMLLLGSSFGPYY